MASGSSPSNLVNLIPDRLVLNCGLQSEIFVLDQILESLGAEILRLDFTQFFEFSPDIQSNLHKIHQFCDDLAIRLSRKGPGLLVFSVPAKHYIQASFIFAAFMTLYFDWTIDEAKRMFPHLNLNEPSQGSVSFPYFVNMLRHVRYRSCLPLLASCQSPITNAFIACDEEAARNAEVLREAAEARRAWCGEEITTSSAAATRSTCIFRSSSSALLEQPVLANNSESG